MPASPRWAATAPSNATPYTTTTPRTTTTSSPSPSAEPPTAGSPTIPPQAFDEIRAQGVNGSDQQLSDLMDLACIMSAGSFNHSKQDVVDVLIQMGSSLPPQQLDVIVTAALKYSCPEYAGKLGG